MRKIVIEIHPDGVSKIDAQGFQGQTCALATRELELALVGNAPNEVDRKPKPDFYATTGNTNSLRN